MLGFWETKMRNRMVSMYSFAPFLEEAGTLLLAAKHTWHPWSLKRLEELTKLAYTLKDRAKTFRQRGLAWASSVSEFGEDPAYLLSTSVYSRYYGNKTKSTYPEATPYLVSAATQLLFLLLPAFEKVEEMSWEENGLVKWLHEILETLMESPCIGVFPSIPDELLKIISTDAILLECEGLAYTQATLEDSFARNNTDVRRKKKSDLSDAQLRKLAQEIDVSFDTIKEVFETEYSSWWNQVADYRKQAQAQKELFLFSLPVEPSIKDAIRVVWDSGMTTQDNSIRCWDTSELTGSERIIKMFISLLLSFQRNKETEYLNPARTFLETQ